METSMFYGAKKKTFEYAAFLRKHLTPAEELLWKYLRLNSFPYRFKCQHSVSKYVVDIYCHQLRFVIEVDGSIHLLAEIHDNDVNRESFLKSLGLYVHRFTNDQVLYDLENVLQDITLLIPILQAHKPEWHDLNFSEID